MNFPPLLLRLDISSKQGSNIVLWIPMILIWLILLAFVIALLPLILLTALVLLPFGWGRAALFFVPVVGGCICALRGLEVNVKKSDQTMLVSFR
jgi:hypothetical protein